MKNYLNCAFIYFSIAFLVSACENNEKKLKGQTIIEAYVKACGGANKINMLKTYASAGYLFQDSVKMNYRTYVVFPDKIKIETKRPAYFEVSVYTAGNAKSKINDSLFNITNLTALNSFELDAYILPLAHLAKIARNVEYTGIMHENKVALDEVQIEFKNGLSWKVFFNHKLHLVHRIKTSTGFDIRYLKYEKKNDLLFPTVFQFKIGERTLKLLLNEIHYNFSANDNEFYIN